MANSTLVDFYKVKDSDDQIELELVIGFAQTAVSVVRVDSKKVKSDFKDSFKANLGTNRALIGKELFVTTVVHDISKETNNTSVIVKLKKGVRNYEATMKQTVLEEGGISTYSVNIEFFN